MLQTPLTRILGCASPIQQAGFGSSLNVDLAAAVCSAGGIGMVGAALVTAEALDEALRQVKATSQGPVGVNFIVPFFDPQHQGQALDVASAQADLVEFFYGEPNADWVARVHRGGARAAWQVGSTREAEAAEAAGVDIVVLQGVEAGGHVRGTSALLPMLAQALDALSCPVIAAGGICSPRAGAALLAAGASGVRLGTRFVASVESDFHPRYKAALVGAKAGETVYGEYFNELWPGAPHRVLRSALEAARRFEGDAVGQMSAGAQRIDVARFAAFAPVSDATGEVEAMALYAGEGVGEIREVLPAAEIVHRFTAEMAQHLCAAGKLLKP